jgi:hypothetical protein
MGFGNSGGSPGEYRVLFGEMSSAMLAWVHVYFAETA